MAAATAGNEGWRVIYLGTDLPVAEIAETAVRTHARAIGLSMVFADKKSRIAADVRELESMVPSTTTLLIGGSGANSVKHSHQRSQTILLESMSQLHTELRRLGRQ